MKTCILVMLSLALLTGPACSAATWQPLGPDGGGVVFHLRFDAAGPDTLYASSSGGLFRSDDGGDSWTEIDRGLPGRSPGALATDPVHPGTLYFAVWPGGVYKSTDGGESWTAANRGLPPVTLTQNASLMRDLAVDPRQPRRLYLATEIGVFQSDDAGASWRRGSLVAGAFTIAIDPQRKGWIYVGSTRGVYKSTDGGATWKFRRVAAKGPLIGHLAIDPNRPDVVYASAPQSSTRDTAQIYVSRNGGLTWKAGLQPYPLDVQSLIADPGHPGRAWAGTYALPANLYRTDDYGFSWAPVYFHPFSERVSALAIHPDRPVIHIGMVAAFDGPSGIYRSEDTGVSWRSESRGFRSRFVETLAIDPQHGILYAGSAEDGVFVSHDGGVTWTVANLGLSDNPDRSVYRIVPAPSLPSTLYLGTYARGVFRSDDGGTHWFRRANGLLVNGGISPVFGLAVSPVDPQTVWVGGSDGVFRSHDGGLSWTNVSVEEHVSIAAVAVAPSRPDRLYAGGGYFGFSGDQLFRSDDGGSTWQACGLKATAVTDLVIDPADPDHLWVAGNGLFESADACASGAQLTSPASLLSDLERSPSGTLYVLTGFGSPAGRIFESTDGGATWIRLDDDTIAKAYLFSLKLDPTAPETLYATGVGGVWRLTP
jgi:photosystem II stability/assembly factor-like uncharacterized protein